MAPYRTSLGDHHVRAATASPLALDTASLHHFLDQCHRRRHPARSDIFRPGDPATTLYYVINGSLSVISEEPDGRELVLGYINAGEFIGEMGLFVEAQQREVLLRSRTACELAELSYERLHQLFAGSLAAECPKILYAIGAQLSKRLLDTSRKASRLAFLDVAGRISRTLGDLCQEPDAMRMPPDCPRPIFASAPRTRPAWRGPRRWPSRRAPAPGRRRSTWRSRRHTAPRRR